MQPIFRIGATSSGWRAISVRTRSSLHPQIFRGLPAFALDDIEFNLRAFDEGAITGLLYFLNVNEDVPAAVVVLDETVASLFVKPLHSPARHGRPPILKPEQIAS